MASPDPLRVRVAFSPRAGEVDEVAVSLSTGATVADAIAAAQLEQRHPGVDVSSLAVGVWGKVCSVDEALREGDRVELYRALTVDPKEARRQRYKAHLAKYPAKT